MKFADQHSYHLVDSINPDCQTIIQKCKELHAREGVTCKNELETMIKLMSSLKPLIDHISFNIEV